jgi:hypothetical protein
LSKALSPWLRRLDHLPAGWDWGTAIVLGALAGAALVGVAPRVVGILGFVALLGLAAALAWSSEPIAVDIGAPRQQPEPVYTSRFLDLVLIPSGTFWMGSPRNEEGRYLPSLEVAVDVNNQMDRPSPCHGRLDSEPPAAISRQAQDCVVGPG